MSSRRKSLTAVFLATLYSVVGLTGESLHYLVEDVSLAVRQVKVDRAGGYFHTHQPDNHVHFHRFHRHHDHGQLARSKNDAIAQDEQGKSGVRSNVQFHSPHACPLLTIVQQLKLGRGGFAPLIVESTASRASLAEFTLCHGFEPAYLSLPRGPPSKAYLA